MALVGGPVATRCIAGSSALAFINRLALTDSAGAWRGWIEGRSGHQDELLIHVHPSILPCSCGRNDSPRGAHTPPHGGGDRGRGMLGGCTPPTVTGSLLTQSHHQQLNLGYATLDWAEYPRLRTQQRPEGRTE
jgi:hypothetical protein